MREILTFVRGAVANREGAVPVLTRFHISGGRIQGANGRIAIEAPCAELDGIEVLVQADKFLAAVDACDSEPKLDTTDNGRLSVKRNKFKCYLPTQAVDFFPRHHPTPGKKAKPVASLLSTLSRLRPFVGEDATRPWVLTLFADGQTAYATNSNMIASVPAPGLKCQLPVFLIDELLRIGQEPSATTHDENSATFFYGNSWLRSQLIVDEWPIKTAQELLAWKKKKLQPIPEDLISAIESILPFCPDPKLPLVFFTPEGVATAPGETQAQVRGVAWPPLGFDSRNLLPMLRASTKLLLDPEQGRGLFEGGNGFRGTMAGIKTSSGVVA